MPGAARSPAQRQAWRMGKRRGRKALGAVDGTRCVCATVHERDGLSWAHLGPVLARRLELKGRTHLLDIAGGSGIYACCIVAAHSQMKATVFEKPPVDRVARESIVGRGCSGRVEVSV